MLASKIVAPAKVEITEVGDLDLKDHRVFVVEDPEANVPIHRVIRAALLKNKPIMGRGSYMPHVDLKREWVRNPRGQHAGTFSFGAKEAGLAGAMNLFQAVGNAMYDAIGVWIKDFPITPDKVLKALEEKES